MSRYDDCYNQTTPKQVYGTEYDDDYISLRTARRFAKQRSPFPSRRRTSPSLMTSGIARVARSWVN